MLLIKSPMTNHWAFILIPIKKGLTRVNPFFIKICFSYLMAACTKLAASLNKIADCTFNPEFTINSFATSALVP